MAPSTSSEARSIQQNSPSAYSVRSLTARTLMGAIQDDPGHLVRVIPCRDMSAALQLDLLEAARKHAGWQGPVADELVVLSPAEGDPHLDLLEVLDSPSPHQRARLFV